MRNCRTAVLLALCIPGIAGCHSRNIDATVSNHTPSVITLIQVDYPSASFGTQNLAPGADFHYRFQVIGSGPMKLTYTDSAHHDHSAVGPTLQEGAAGSLTMVITPNSIEWVPAATLKATIPPSS